MSLIEYKTLVMREDYDGANSILPTIPQVLRTQQSFPHNFGFIACSLPRV